MPFEVPVVIDGKPVRPPDLAISRSPAPKVLYAPSRMLTHSTPPDLLSVSRSRLARRSRSSPLTRTRPLLSATTTPRPRSWSSRRLSRPSRASERGRTCPGTTERPSSSRRQTSALESTGQYTHDRSVRSRCSRDPSSHTSPSSRCSQVQADGCDHARTGKEHVAGRDRCGSRGASTLHCITSWPNPCGPSQAGRPM